MKPAATVASPTPAPPAEPEPDLRLEWVPSADGGPGTPAPDDLSRPWKIPSSGLIRVHLRTAGPDATATLTDARGRSVPHESRLYLLRPNGGPDGGPNGGPNGGAARIDVDLLDPSATSLSLAITAGSLVRTIPLRVE